MDMRVKHFSPTEETYTELQKVYDYYNEHLFDNQLPGALIVMTRHKRSFGYYCPRRFADTNGREADEIAMNQTYFAVRAVEQVLSTMAHEMVHQWQEHFGKSVKRCYHNKEFSKKMEEIGLITSDTGYPGGRRVGEKVTHYIAEGGKFILATRELLKTSFGIVWYDRHPNPIIMQPPSEEDVQIAVEQRKQEEENKRAKGKSKGGRKKSPVATVSPAKLSSPAITTTQSLATSIGAEVIHQTHTLSPIDTEGNQVISKVAAKILPPPGQEKTSGKRAKYSCASCRDSVWGKAGLNILCGREGCNHLKMEARSF